ncbi:MAG: TonB-dependent receptor, partial [Bacteroidota bacterium]|nr:TonB-dependent receptor [Bacteroidota bacterium]
GQQEGLSFPNSDLIKELAFSSGGFEAKYGDKLSSVLNLKYKIPDSIRSSVTMSLLGGSAHLEGGRRIHKTKDNRFNYLLGGRYKSNAYLLNSQDIKGEYQPSFLDLQSYLTFDISRSLQLGLIGNLNKSKFHLIPESSSQAKGSVFFVLRLNTVFEGEEKDDFEQQMAGISLSYYPIKSKRPYFVKYLSSFYRTIESEQFDILGYYRLAEIEAGDGEKENKETKLWGEGTQHRFTRNFLKTFIHHHEVRGAIEFINKSTSTNSHFLQWGVSVRQEFFKDQINEWERIDSAGYSLPHTGQKVQVNSVLKSNNEFDNFKTSVWLQNAIQIQHNRSLSIRWTPGLRFNYTKLNEEWSISPRLKTEFVPLNHPANLHYWLATGFYFQPPLYRELRSELGTINESLQSQKSFHAVGGIQMDFKWLKISEGTLRWISELYYKSLWDLVSYDLDNVRIRYSALNDSKAYAIGWDNRIHGEFVKGAESWVNVSFLRTREKLAGIEHKEHILGSSEGKLIPDVPRPTDQFFALGLFFQDYLPRNEHFKMHFNATIATGLPYGFKGANVEYRNEYRHKPYHRVDIGFSTQLWDEVKRVQRPNHFLHFSRKAWVSLEVFNLLKIKNEASISWIKSVYNYQFAIPNYLSSRRINLKLHIDF